MSSSRHLGLARTGACVLAVCAALSSSARAQRPTHFDAYAQAPALARSPASPGTVGVRTPGVIARGPAARGPSAGAPQAAGAGVAWTRPSTRRGLVTPPAAWVASIDDKRGVPTFLRAGGPRPDVPQAVRRDPERAARWYLAEQAPRYAASPAALASLRVRFVHAVGQRGVLVSLAQDVSGLEVFRGRVAVLLTADGDLAAIGGNLHEPPATPPGTPAVGPELAVALAVEDLCGVPFDEAALDPLGKSSGGHLGFRPHSGVVVDPGLVFRSDVRVKPVWFPLPDHLELAWYVEVDATLAGDDDGGLVGVVVAASTGDLLFRSSLRAHAQYRVWAEPGGDRRPHDGPLEPFLPHPSGVPDGSHPAAAAPSLIEIDGFNGPADPWLPTGGSETKGNNADVYDDLMSPEGFSAGDLRATQTSPGVFDRTYDITQDLWESADQRQAALIQAFYTVNWLHDWYYDSGFDEVAGNAQESNYGRGGVEEDPLLVQLEEGTENNAYMECPADGQSPRMRLGVYANAGGLFVKVGGEDVEGVGPAYFGPTTFTVTGLMVQADSGTGAGKTLACAALVNDVAGKIVLIDEGSCSMAQKAQRAQDAGALGVLIAGAAFNKIPELPADPAYPGVEIPVLAVRGWSGYLIEQQLADAGPVEAVMHRALSSSRPSSVDTGVVAHEWGHYLHHRLALVGSAQSRAASEGWGDFLALHLLYPEGGAVDGTFATGIWTASGSGEDGAYYGGRRFPYSTDMSRNPLTFAHISDSEGLPQGVPQIWLAAPNSEAHNAGEVWASMLWEAYMGLIGATSGPAATLTYAEARRRMADYIVAGLMLAPADATFPEQRDALMAAAMVNDPADALTIATAFAKRGAGACAVAPPRYSADFEGVTEDYALGPEPVIEAVDFESGAVTCDDDATLDSGETGQVVVRLLNAGVVPLTGAKVKVKSATEGVSFVSGGTVAVGPIPPLGTGTVSVPVILAPGISSVVDALFEVSVLKAGGCAALPTVERYALLNQDALPQSSNVETASVDEDVWQDQGTPGVWGRARLESGAHVFHGDDGGYSSDASLISPPLEVAVDEPLVIHFVHAYSFEQAFGFHKDGGVIELSTDGGASWQDISQWADPGYDGTLPDNVTGLASRPAYAGASVGFPALIPVELDLGMQLKGETVQLRFRIGTTWSDGDYGWYIDDVQVDGTTNLPFTGVAVSTPAVVYADDDGDGHGSSEGQSVCPPPPGAATTSDDCDDADASAYPDAPELCDGLDNDCDEEIDETWTLGGACSEGVGACAAEGVTVCAADGLGATCSASPSEPAEETCDGADNDCDGEVDDGLGLDEPCTVGVGLCAASGVMVCGADGGTRCSAVALPPPAGGCGGDTGGGDADAGAGADAVTDAAPGAGAEPDVDPATGEDSGAGPAVGEDSDAEPGAGDSSDSGPGAGGDTGSTSGKKKGSGCAAGRDGRSGGWAPLSLLLGSALLLLPRRRRPTACA